MKKINLLWLSAILLMVAGCSNEYDYVQEFNSNDEENFIGTWHMISYSSGWGGTQEYKAGEITVTFTKKGKVKVVNRRDDQSPIPTSTFSYSFVNIEKSIYTGEPAKCISLDFIIPYHYTFDQGYLYLSEEAYDGLNYTLQKLK